MRFRKMKHKQSLSAHLGMKVTELSKDEVILSMPVNETTCQPFGYLHGGASAALAETAASIGSLLYMAEGEYPVGISLSIQHITAVDEGYVYAKAIPIKIGNTMLFWRIEINHPIKGSIAEAQCTIVRKKDKI